MSINEGRIRGEDHTVRHTSKRLPDGRLVCECRCGTTIGITFRDADHLRFKIHLRGGKNLASRSFDLGGRCPRCRLMHAFDLDEIAQAVGQPDFRSLIAAEGFSLETSKDHVAWWNHFHANILFRMDGGKLVWPDI